MSNKKFMPLFIENCTIWRKNFSMNNDPYNPAKRTFMLFLDNEELLHDIQETGIPVKMLQPRTPEESPRPFIKVEVTKFDELKVRIITSKGQRIITDREKIDFLDYSRLTDIDLIIQPAAWENTKLKTSGVKAWMTEMTAKITESPMDLKYADVPMIGETIDLDSVPNE